DSGLLRNLGGRFNDSIRPILPKNLTSGVAAAKRIPHSWSHKISIAGGCDHVLSRFAVALERRSAKQAPCISGRDRASPLFLFWSAKNRVGNALFGSAIWNRGCLSQISCRQTCRDYCRSR